MFKTLSAPRLHCETQQGEIGEAMAQPPPERHPLLRTPTPRDLFKREFHEREAALGNIINPVKQNTRDQIDLEFGNLSADQLRDLQRRSDLLSGDAARNRHSKQREQESARAAIVQAGFRGRPPQLDQNHFGNLAQTCRCGIRDPVHGHQHFVGNLNSVVADGEVLEHRPMELFQLARSSSMHLGYFNKGQLRSNGQQKTLFTQVVQF